MCKLKTIVPCCLIMLCGYAAGGRPTETYIRWVRGTLDMPSEVAKTETLSELQPFLGGRQELIRMAAVRRVGQLGGDEAVPALLEVFASEQDPQTKIPFVKLEVIRTLRGLNTEESKSALLSVLQTYWGDGPRTENKRAYLLDRDFVCVMGEVLRALDAWYRDAEVFLAVEAVALSEDLRQFYLNPREFGHIAWQVYLKAKMVRESVLEPEASAQYLLSFMETCWAKGVVSDKLAYFKYRAARSVLEGYSLATLSSLAASLTQEIREERPHLGGLTERGISVRFKVGVLRGIIEERERRNDS